MHRDFNDRMERQRLKAFQLDSAQECLQLTKGTRRSAICTQRLNSWTSVKQKTRFFSSILLTISSSGGFYKKPYSHTLKIHTKIRETRKLESIHEYPLVVRKNHGRKPDKNLEPHDSNLFIETLNKKCRSRIQEFNFRSIFFVFSSHM